MNDILAALDNVLNDGQAPQTTQNMFKQPPGAAITDSPSLTRLRQASFLRQSCFFFRGMYPSAERDILKNPSVLLPHTQRQVPESIPYRKVALPRTLELRPNHALCLRRRQSWAVNTVMWTLVYTQACPN
jgi:hypothetical protein